MHAGAELASLGTTRKNLGLLHGKSWHLPPTRRDRDMALLRDRPWFPPYPPKVQTVLCLSQPPSVQGDNYLHVDWRTKDFNITCCFAEKKVDTDDVFQDLFFPYILTSCLTCQWLLFKLTTAELQNVAFVLKTMTENFICIQMPTGLWYFNNKTAGLKAHDEKSD